MLSIQHFPLFLPLGLLPLGIVAYYGWQLSRQPSAAFTTAGALAALLLLLGQLPILLVLHLAFPRVEAGVLGLLLVGGGVYVAYRLLPVLARFSASARWRPVLLGLAVADAAGGVALLARPVPALPVWVGELALALGVMGLSGLLAWVHGTAARLETQPLGQPPAAPAPTHFLTVAEARRAYYRQAKALTPRLVEYLRWFHTLPADSRSAARLAGPGTAWTDRRFRRSFRHFVLEHRGHSYVDFMAGHLDVDQFVRWVNLLQLAAPDDAALAKTLRR